MNEFNNRVQAQRTILREVNSILKLDEELCGLSLKAIERWAHINNMDICGDVVSTLKKLSSKLFFLANKSQEQISDAYKIASSEIAELTEQLRHQVLVARV